MTARHELLYDTAASLRLVDHELSAHHGVTTEPAAAPGLTPSGLTALPRILERATGEIEAVLAGVRDSRLALEAATVEKIQHTSEKLREVTAATEIAAHGMLDGLDRAQALVDALDAAETTGDGAASRQTREQLRAEIFGMIDCLQFQDITTQQLAYASSVLTDMEGRLFAVARLFDPAAVVRPATHRDDPGAFDRHATTRDAARRQSVADELFSSAEHR